MTQEQETDIQAALNEFYVRSPLTRIFVGDDYINYKTGGSDYANAYCLDEAERIIKKFNLPLKAEIQGFPFKKHSTNKIKMKSKEEIFESGGIGELREMEYEEHIKSAMDEYAKEVALDFLSWVNNTNIKDERLFQLYKNKTT